MLQVQCWYLLQRAYSLKAYAYDEITSFNFSLRGIKVLVLSLESVKGHTCTASQ